MSDKFLNRPFTHFCLDSKVAFFPQVFVGVNVDKGPFLVKFNENNKYFSNILYKI